MSSPPPAYPREIEGQLCGASWPKTLVVTGQLPGRVFGKAFKHTIEPVVTKVPTLLGPERKDDAEDLRDTIQARINLTRDQMDPRFVPSAEATLLDESQVDAIEWLLVHAEAEMDAAMDGVLNMMPTDLVRAAITLHFRDALAHVRCAQYGVWKLRMVSKAAAAAGFALRTERVIPEEWQAESLPRTESLPPPEEVPLPVRPWTPHPDAEPEAAAGPEEGPLPSVDPDAPPRSKKANTALIVGGVALGALLWKGLK